MAEGGTATINCDGKHERMGGARGRPSRKKKEGREEN